MDANSVTAQIAASLFNLLFFLATTNFLPTSSTPTLTLYTNMG